MAKRARADEETPYIAAPLRPLKRPVGDLVPDPANANKHTKDSLEKLKALLVQYGQLKPIVVQEQGMIIRAGNGTYKCALALGWTHIAATVLPMSDVQAVSFAIADNRVAELSEWDPAALKALLPEVEVGEPALQEMFAGLADEYELYADIEPDPEEEPDPEPQQPEVPAQFKVLVTCADEAAQAELLERLTGEGYECRSLTA